MTDRLPAGADPWDRVTVVMVVHNSAFILPQAMAGLGRAKRIIVVDTASRDSTVAVASRFPGRVTVIQNRTDPGLAGAYNQGFAAVQTDYVLNMNPDATIDSVSVGRLVATADACPDAIAVAPVLANRHGRMELDVMGFGERHHRKIGVAPDGAFCSRFVNGAVVLWRLAHFRALGGYDEDIFIYNEDADICLRASRAGYSLIVEPEARGSHAGGGSEKPGLRSRVRRDWNMAWGHLYYEKKHGQPGEADAAARALAASGLRDAARALASLRPGKMLGNLAKVRAAVGFLRGARPWGRA